MPLYHLLKETYAENTDVLVLRHSRNVARLMDAADLLVSKPGGLTSAEALAKGLPVIIISPLPGQEERNASFLIRHAVAERCDSIAQLPAQVSSFLSHPYKLKKFSAQAAGLAHPYASQDIAQYLLQFLSLFPAPAAVKM